MPCHELGRLGEEMGSNCAAKNKSNVYVFKMQYIKLLYTRRFKGGLETFFMIHFSHRFRGQGATTAERLDARHAKSYKMLCLTILFNG